MKIEKIRRSPGFHPITNSTNQAQRLKVELKTPKQTKTLNLAHRQSDRVKLTWDSTQAASPAQEAAPTERVLNSSPETAEKPDSPPEPTPEERFVNLSDTLLSTLGEQGRAKMVKRALKRSPDGPDGLEKALALTARREARQHLDRLCPGLPEGQIRLEAASRPNLAAVLKVYDAAGSYLGIEPREAQSQHKAKPTSEEARLQEKRERQQTLNKLREITAQMMAENQKSWAEIRRIQSETHTAVMEIWLGQMAKRAALQQKQFQQFMMVLQEVKAA